MPSRSPSGATSGRSRSTTVKPRSSGTPGATGTLGAMGSGGTGTIGSVCATAATGAALKARPHAIIPAGSFRPIDFDPDLWSATTICYRPAWVGARQSRERTVACRGIVTDLPHIFRAITRKIYEIGRPHD